VSKRNGSEIKQLSVAIGMARKQRLYYFKNLFLHSTIVGLK